MASSSSKGGDMKGFYRQKKGTIAKKPTKSSSSKPQHHSAATMGSSVTQPPVLTSHASPRLSDERDDVREEEVALRQFDMNMAYGPCLGMSRLARWERAKKFGMNPPTEVEKLLKLPQARPDCLWEGRV